MTNQILKVDPVKPAVLLVGDGGVSENVRAKLPGKVLSERGYNVLAGRIDAIQKRDIRHDVAILSRIASPELVGMLHNMSIRVIVDIDDDFFSIPPDHPGYKAVGGGNPHYLKRLEDTIAMADLVTVTTPELLQRLTKHNRRIHVIPNGWDKDNPFWKIKYRHDTINVGWAGTITHREDFQLCKQALVRLTKRFPQVKIFIGGDPQIYKMLSSIPENQKQLIPMVPFEYYPHIFGYLDLWLAPLLDTEFNRAKSDIKLVDAGASRTAYMASLVTNYERWGTGGVLIENSCDWFKDLEWLVQLPDTRAHMAQAGWERAQEREIRAMAPIWEYAIEEALK